MMKKLVFGVALMAFVGGTAFAVTTISENATVKTEVQDDDDKKKKKKKKCSKKSCCKKSEKSSCKKSCHKEENGES